MNPVNVGSIPVVIGYAVESAVPAAASWTKYQIPQPKTPEEVQEMRHRGLPVNDAGQIIATSGPGIPGSYLARNFKGYNATASSRDDSV